MPTTTLARTSDPITSKMAAPSPASKTLMVMLLEQFVKKSMTAEEAGTAARLLHIGYWKRVSDLKNYGWIMPRAGANGKPLLSVNRSGKKAQVYVITATGRQALRSFKAEAKAALKTTKS